MEGLLQSAVTAGYPQLEGRRLVLFRYDPLADAFPDSWWLEEGEVVRRYTSRGHTLGISLRVLHQGATLRVGDTAGMKEVGEHLPAGVRSFVAVPVRVHDAPWGVLYVTSSCPGDFGEEDVRFIESLARQIGAYVQESSPGTVGNVELSTVRVLAATVDAKDHYTRHHSTNVAFYARQLARTLNLDPAEVRRIELAGLLHDIGKIAIPDQVLQKPGKLSPEERMLIETHAAIGANILAEAPHLRMLVPLVRHHHEWYNGGGYPDGLKGDQIPLGAAILCVADAFDTMTTCRVYRRALTLDEALTELRRCSGAQFHPDVVKAMEAMVDQARFGREPWLEALSAGHPGALLPEESILQTAVEALNAVAQRQDPLELLADARLIQRLESLEAVLERSGELLVNFWAADAVLIYLVNREGGTLRLAWSQGSAAAQPYLSARRAQGNVPLAEGLLGWSALTNQGITLADVRRDPRWDHLEELEGPVSCLVAPIVAGGPPAGVIQLLSCGESRFGRTDLQVLKVFGSLLAQALTRLEEYDRSVDLFCTDLMTGVRNVNYLQVVLERMEQQRFEGPISVAFVDGDDLQEVNEKFGRDAGDLIIQHMARCLSAWQRPEDVVMRYAGDDFVIVFPGLSLPEAVDRLEQIRMAVSETPVELPDGNRIHVSVSCGVTEVDLARGAYKALRAADQAMYNAKRSGKNRVWTAAV